MSMLLLNGVTKMLLTPRPWLGQFLAGGGITVPREYAHAVKLWVIIGGCDGWMGLMPSLLSGCYISLRCGMRVGNEGGCERRLDGFPDQL